MPYVGQRAGKTGHSSFFAKELEDFLSNCHYLKTLAPEEHALVETFKKKINPQDPLRKWLWASDGSRYIASVQDGAPTTRIGYIKVSHVGFKWDDYINLLPKKQRFVNPISVAKLRESMRTVVWMLPGSNVQYKTTNSAKSGFRLRLHELFKETLVNTSKVSLYETLFKIKAAASGIKQDEILHVRECPECRHRFNGQGLAFQVHDDGLPCPVCNANIFPSDILGFHQEFEEHGANEGLFTRLMATLEVLLMVQRWTSKEQDDIEFTENAIFFYDGLLGLYGEAAWLCKGILKIYLELKHHLLSSGKKPPLVIGVAKTGQLMHHAEAILNDLEINDVVPLSLNYRRNILKQNIDDPRRPFFSTRWGQEFIWRSPQNQPVVISLPFWTTDFENEKENIHAVENYPELAEVVGALSVMDCALFPSAFIPIVLAHEEASIAWEPGGRLLTEATKKALLAGSSQE